MHDHYSAVHQLYSAKQHYLSTLCIVKLYAATLATVFGNFIHLTTFFGTTIAHWDILVNFSLSNWSTSADHHLGTFDMHEYSANLVQTLQGRLLELPTSASFHTARSKHQFWGNTLHTWQLAVRIFLRAVFLPKLNFPCNIGQWSKSNLHSFRLTLVIRKQWG